METNKELMARNLVDVALGVLSAWGKPVAELGERSTEKLCKELQSAFAAALSQRSEAVPSAEAGEQVPSDDVIALEMELGAYKALHSQARDAMTRWHLEAKTLGFDGVADALASIAAQPTPAQGDSVPVAVNDYSDMSREALERHATRMAQALDNDKARKFHDKYATGPMMPPSCLCCGQLPDKVAIRHAELPGIVICEKCATRQSSADAVDAAKWREWAAMCKRVDSELPDGWLITYDMGPEVWGVSLRNPDGEHVGFHTCDCESDAEMVICALDAAIAAQGGEGGA